MTDGTKGIVPLMISVMQSKRIGLTVLEAAANVIAAESRLNMWILRDVKPTAACTTEDQFMQILDFWDEIHQRCETAVAQFEKDGDNQPLEAALSKIAAELNDAPTIKPFWSN